MEKELKFEKALEQLEKIVEDLEAGNIPLEEALKKYEEASIFQGPAPRSWSRLKQKLKC